MCFLGRAHHIRPSPGTTCGACGIFQDCATTCQTTILCRGHLASEKFSNQFQSIDFPTLLPVCIGGSQSILKLAGFSIFCNFSTFLIFQQDKHHHNYHDHDHDHHIEHRDHDHDHDHHHDDDGRHLSTGRVSSLSARSLALSDSLLVRNRRLCIVNNVIIAIIIIIINNHHHHHHHHVDHCHLKVCRFWHGLQWLLGDRARASALASVRLA